MKVILITGGTRGIGFGMAKSFLLEGCQVVICGRNETTVSNAVKRLQSLQGAEDVIGFPCDVSKLDQVEALWAKAKAHFGKIDIWINNAGIGHQQIPSWDLDPEEIKKIVDINILGMIYGSRVAMRGMIQQGFGQIYNLEGFGSRGNPRGRMKGMSVYGTSKAATTFFTNALAQEAGSTPVKIGSLLPGMVMTDLVLERFKEKPEELERLKPIFNIIGHSVDEVAPILAKRMLDNQDNGVQIAVDNMIKIAFRFLTSKFVKRNIFDN